MSPSHQPGRSSSRSLYFPAACALAERAWQTRTAFDFSALSVPNVSYAIVNGTIVSPCVKRNPPVRVSCFGGAARSVLPDDCMRRARIALRPLLSFQLAFIDRPYLVDRRDLLHRLVVADARDAGKAERVA